MSKIKPILCVVTSNGVKGSTGLPTGYWLSELIHPLNEFENAGLDYEVVSIKGGEPPIDPASMDLKDEVNAKFWDNAKFRDRLRNTRTIDEVKSEDYSAIFFVGGHGPLWDFPNNVAIHNIVREIYERGDLISAVCHGPCALINIQLSNLDYLIKGKKIVSFTNDEEIEVQSTDIVPFALETSLTNHHALFQTTSNWANKVVVDGQLITGQNPYSAASLGKAVADALLEKNK